MTAASTVIELYSSILSQTVSIADTTAADYNANAAGFQAAVDAGSLTLAQVQTSLFATTRYQNVEAVTRIYQAAFNRQPDSSGLTFWVDAIEAGTLTIDSVAENFAVSTEFTTRFPTATTSSDAFIVALYNNVLGRAPDAEGLAFWQASGQSAAQLLTSFSESAEFQTATDGNIQTLFTNVAAGTALDPTAPLTTTTTTTTGQTFTLTSGTDTGASFTGGSNDDAFIADLINESGVANVTTLNSTDVIDGGAGNDTLTATYDDAVSATISNIETFTLSDRGGNAFDFVNITGVTDINITASTAAVDLNNIAAIPTTVDISNQAVAVDLDFAAAAVSGSSDTLALTLAAVTGGNLTVDTGIEALTIASNGSSANTLGDVIATTGLASITVTGSQDLTITNELNDVMTTLDASAATGAVTAVLGTNNSTVTGGTGNDSFSFGTTDGDYTVNDTVNGGDGTDSITVRDDDIKDATIATQQTNLTNVETIIINDGAALTADTYLIDFVSTSLTTVAVAAGTAGAVTLRLNDASTVSLTAGTALGGALTLSTQGSATTDSVTLALNAQDDANNIVATGFETLNISSTDTGSTVAANTPGTVTLGQTAATETINIVGTEAITFGAITADVVNASTFTGALTMVAGNVSGGGLQVTGGSGNDALFGVANSSDVIIGGAGNDSITFDIDATASDLLTGGAGNDTFIMSTTTDTDPTALSITDFSNSGDNGVDNLDLSLTAIEGVDGVGNTTIADLETSAGNASAAAGDITFAQVANDSVDGTLSAGDEAIVLTGATYTDTADVLANAIGAGDANQFTLANAVTDNDGILIIYFTAGGDTRIAVGQFNGASADSEDIDSVTDLVTLSGVSQAELLAANLDLIA